MYIPWDALHRGPGGPVWAHQSWHIPFYGIQPRGGRKINEVIIEVNVILPHGPMFWEKHNSKGIWLISSFKMTFLEEVTLTLKSEEWVGCKVIWKREHRGFFIKTSFDRILYLCPFCAYIMCPIPECDQELCFVSHLPPTQSGLLYTGTQ